MSAARLIVWRHGRTEWNSTGRFQGQADVPLDDLGREQARRAAAVLARLEPAMIMSSDLVRAWDTAVALGERCGLAVEPDPRLREIDVGTWEGLTAAEVERVDPELTRRFLAGEDVRRSATGETVGEVAARVMAAMVEAADRAPDGSTVVISTHGVGGRVGACRLVGLLPQTWRLLGGLHNCGWIRIDRHRGDYWRIEEYNMTAPATPTPDEPI